MEPIPVRPPTIMLNATTKANIAAAVEAVKQDSNASLKDLLKDIWGVVWGAVDDYADDALYALAEVIDDATKSRGAAVQLIGSMSAGLLRLAASLI